MVEGPRPYSGYGGYVCVGVAGSYGACPYTGAGSYSEGYVGGAGSYRSDVYSAGAHSYGQGYSAAYS